MQAAFQKELCTTSCNTNFIGGCAQPPFQRFLTFRVQPSFQRVLHATSHSPHLRVVCAQLHNFYTNPTERGVCVRPPFEGGLCTSFLEPSFERGLYAIPTQPLIGEGLCTTPMRPPHIRGNCVPLLCNPNSRWCRTPQHTQPIWGRLRTTSFCHSWTVTTQVSRAFNLYFLFLFFSFLEMDHNGYLALWSGDHYTPG